MLDFDALIVVMGIIVDLRNGYFIEIFHKTIPLQIEYSILPLFLYSPILKSILLVRVNILPEFILAIISLFRHFIIFQRIT